MNFTELEKYEGMIQKILAENAAAIRETEERLAESETKLKAAEERSAGAVRRGDRKAYADAQTEARELNFDLRFLRQRLATLRTAPLLDDGEYKAALAAVRAEADANFEAAAAEVEELATGRMVALRDKIFEMERRADTAIRQLQQDVRRTEPDPATAAMFMAPRLERREGYVVRLPRHPGKVMNQLITEATGKNL